MDKSTSSPQKVLNATIKLQSSIENFTASHKGSQMPNKWPELAHPSDYSMS